MASLLSQRQTVFSLMEATTPVFPLAGRFLHE
jgi:hypothetical protein